MRLLVLGLLTLGFSMTARAAEVAKAPAAKADLVNTDTAKAGSKKNESVKADAPKLETAVLAAGCFWGTEEYFRKIPGVVETRAGYTGGHTTDPHYQDLHSGETGHAESVEIKFDPKKVSYTDLLNKFFKMHDPTTKDRQGNDVGSQYRSAIFYTTPAQKKEAEAFKAKVEKSKAWKSPIMTEVVPEKAFFAAEDYHQKYLQKHKGGYDNHFERELSFDKK